MFDIFYIGNAPAIADAVKVNSIVEAQQLSRTRYCWVVNYLCDYTDFDFLWEPKPWDSQFIHAWASQWQVDSETYLIPSVPCNKVKYHSEVIKRKPDATNWNIPNNVDVADFDFSWHPDTTEPPYIYQVGTQHQKTGGPRYTVPSATIVKYIGEITINHISICNENVYFIDHNNISNSEIQVSESFDNVIKTRFISSYMGTLKRIVRKLNNGYIWVTSSLCDYTDFDFSWHPEQWQSTMLHVFSSNEQKFGDTFLINVESFNDRIGNTEILEWYDTINFITDCSVPRWDIPTVRTTDDSIVNDVKRYNFIEPLVLFTNEPKQYKIPTINLWREKTRTVTPLSNGANTTIVPRDAMNHIITQVYDYPYVSKKHITHVDNPLDIIYISNGESNAEKNWNHLLTVTNGLPNKIKRVDKVDGRVQAYQQAAKLSDTAWFFAVFAKLEVNENFDWNWQPDRLQQSKHYIFHAKNPITGLEYGHMAMIAYNKELVLDNDAPGLDFTLDQEHEVVPVLSGTAYYADNIGTAWRSAFREVIKLKDSSTIDNEYRLQKWLDSSDTELGIWSQRGAEDAVEYYENVNGEFDKLRLSYEWKWLNVYFNAKYDKEHAL
jgi:hypothetical protein